MRIGIDIRSIGRKRTGDETYTTGLVKSLARLDRKNKYFLFTDTADAKELDKIDQALELENENFKIVPILPASKMLWTFWSLPKHLKKNPVDILHVQYIVPQKLPKKTKLITTVHDISFERYPQFISKKDLFFLRMLIPPSLKRADKIIAVSNFTKKEIQDVFGTREKKVVAIQNGGHQEGFVSKLSEEDEKVIKEKNNLSKPYILYLGTLQPRKNVPFLIEGFAQLKKEHSNFQKIKDLELVIVGSRKGKNYDKKIDEVIEKIKKDDPETAKQIRMVGYVPEKEKSVFFHGAEFFCSASLYEGFGIPLIESMSVGTPVLCSNSSSFTEVVQDAGGLFEENDAKDFSEKAREILTDDERKKELIEKGKEQAKKFSWERSAKETLDVYSSFSGK